MLYLEFLFLLLMLYIGSRYGGIGLGVVSGIGLAIEVFVFRMPVGKAPIDVMLIILAVVTCASVLEAAGGLKFMLQIAERILRKIQNVSLYSGPLVVYLLTFMLGTGHFVYTIMPIIGDVALKKTKFVQNVHNGSVFGSIALSHHIKPTFCSCCIFSRLNYSNARFL